MFNENQSYSQIRVKEKGESTKAPLTITDSKTLSSKKSPVEKATSFPQSEWIILHLQRIWRLNRRVWGLNNETK